MTDAELAWAAGIFEGEGSVRINPHTSRNRGHLLVEVTNCDVEIVTFFETRWGGSIKRTATPKPGHRTAYRWRASSRMAAAFLSDVLPNVRTRRYRERVLLGLAYQAQKAAPGTGRWIAGYAVRQVEFFERMAVLNRRGA